MRLKIIGCMALLAALLVIASGCSSEEEPNTTTSTTTSSVPQISQGVSATIKHRYGNCMPLIEEESLEGCGGVRLDEPVTVILKQEGSTEDEQIVYSETKQVIGNIEQELPVGNYYMYVVFNREERCDLSSDANNDQCEFTVFEDKVTNYELVINDATD